MRTPMRTHCAAMLLLSVSCSEVVPEKEEGPPTEVLESAPPTEPPAAAHEEPEPESPTGGVASLTATLRLHAKKGSKRVGSVKRGETLKLWDEGDGWYRVGTLTGLNGWLSAKAIVLTHDSDDIRLATNLEELSTFKRPDIVAVDADIRIPPASLLLLRKSRGDFAEVNIQGQKFRWVKRSGITTATDEVAVCRLMLKAKAVRERDEVAAGRLLRQAHEYEHAKLRELLPAIDTLPEEVEKEEPEESGDAPVHVTRSMVVGFWDDSGGTGMGHDLRPGGRYEYEGPMGDRGRWSFDGSDNTITLEVGLRAREGPAGERIAANPTEILWEITAYDDNAGTMSVKRLDCRQCPPEVWERQ